MPVTEVYVSGKGTAESRVTFMRLSVCMITGSYGHEDRRNKGDDAIMMCASGKICKKILACPVISDIALRKFCRAAGRGGIVVVKRTGNILAVLLCTVMCILCASGQKVQKIGVRDPRLEQDTQGVMPHEAQDLQGERVWGAQRAQDHYFLYRAGTDGSQPQCLAKVHPGSICVQDDEIYFINLSDGNGIYRMRTDGSSMEKLCDYGRELQIVGEYIFFCSTYRAAYVKTGMVREEPSGWDSGFLYRMKRDGSEPELIAVNVWKYVSGYGNGQKTRDACFLYYSYQDTDGICVRKIDLDGQMEEQICYFDIPGNMMVYGDSIYCVGIYYEDREQVSRYCFGDGEVTEFKIPEYTDCCIYDGRFYGINETEEENGRKIMIYRMDHDMQGHEVLYEDLFSCEYANAGYISDMYASEEGLFFRKFVSPTEGCQWFRLTESEMTGEWTAEEWEDRERIPATLPAGNIEYGERGGGFTGRNPWNVRAGGCGGADRFRLQIYGRHREGDLLSERRRCADEVL